MGNQIKVLIADDNKPFCDILKNFLKKDNRIDVIGIAYTDEEEIEQIKNNKPDVVISDLKRNKGFTGLDIIKDYEQKDNTIKFLVISSGANEFDLYNRTNVIGFIKKPFIDYDKIFELILDIKND